MKTFRRKIIQSGTGIVLSLALVFQASAATVRQVGLGTMIEASELVFHGKALNSRTSQGDRAGEIYTHVTFAVNDVVKGNDAYEGNTVELVFLGGTYGRYRLDISDQALPMVGEEGVYFIEQLDRRQVNPIFGWHQGRFVVAYDSVRQTKMARTFSGEPIYELTTLETPMALEINDGPAEGVRIQDFGGEEPLSLQVFKLRLAQMAEAQR